MKDIAQSAMVKQISLEEREQQPAAHAYDQADQRASFFGKLTWDCRSSRAHTRGRSL